MLSGTPGKFTMLTVVFLATPLCVLKTLTALKQFGVLSMLSILILGVCILFRSLQMQLGRIARRAKPTELSAMARLLERCPQCDAALYIMLCLSLQLVDCPQRVRTSQ